MHKKLITFIFIVLIAARIEAANLSTTVCPGSGCVDFVVSGAGTIGIQITGTWVGTVTFRSTIDNTNYTSFRVVSAADTASAGVTTTTANGIFNGTVASFNIIRVVFTAYTSGTAVVTSKTSTQSAKFTGGGGGGGGTPASPDTSIQFNNAGAFGGSSTLTYLNPGVGIGGDGTTASLIQATGAASNIAVNVQGKGHGFLQIGPNTYGGTGTLGFTTALEIYRLAANSTQANVNEFFIESHTSNSVTGSAEGIFLDILSENTIGNSLTRLTGMNATAEHRSTGTVGILQGLYTQANNGGGGTVGEISGVTANTYNNSGTTTNSYNFKGYAQSSGGLTNAFGVYIGEMGAAVVSATNRYPLWFDEDGVYRVRADNTFNSVFQGIAALYNPQFTKYTPGAANFERCIPGCQFNSNVAEIGNEKGGTGVLRATRLIGANVSIRSTLSPTVSNTSAASCGTTAATISGNDNIGKVTVGLTSGTSCTVSFATAFLIAPSCSVTNETTANLSRATSATGSVILAGTFAASDVLSYMCIGR